MGEIFETFKNNITVNVLGRSSIEMIGTSTEYCPPDIPYHKNQSFHSRANLKTKMHLRSSIVGFFGLGEGQVESWGRLLGHR
jgi:hypothetical protein